jgi:hypothetical protein
MIRLAPKSHPGNDLLIINAINHDRGWGPVQHMVSVAAQLFDCEVATADTSKPSSLAKISSVLRQRRRNKTGNDTCLLVCTGPPDLLSVLNVKSWRTRFRFLAAWVIDSFWVDHIPRFVRLGSPFDHFFVTSVEDVDLWRKITGVETTWLPWGTDALQLGHGGASREWDLMRVGRQPPEWDDDHGTGLAAEKLGIKHRGRPDSAGLNSLQNEKLMMAAYGATKFTLAFSNAVNRDANNHPSREYLTGRWVDALGSGSIVAGIAPRGPNTDGLLWPGATLELGSIRRDEGLQVIGDALKQWTPAAAAANHLMALKRLDWRWRFNALAQVLDVSSVALSSELKVLEERIARLTSP